MTEATDVSDVPAGTDVVNEWHHTACILCSINCGIEVRLDGRQFVRIRGDKAHLDPAVDAAQDAGRLVPFSHIGHGSPCQFK